MADLHSIAHELYGLPLAEFIETRDAWAATEREGGDAKLAKDVRALRKPSATAWAVNALARRQPDLLEELVELGGQLRQAQVDADGARMRSLDQDRRRLMAKVAAQAMVVAEEYQQPLGPAAAASIGETMKAALADPDAGRAVLDGMLVAGLSAPGFGAVDLSDTVAIEPSPGSQPDEIREARKAASAASRAASVAGKASATARDRLEAVATQQADLRSQLADVSAQAEKLERRLADVDRAFEAREHDVTTTTSDEAVALQSLDRAESLLADLEG